MRQSLSSCSSVDLSVVQAVVSSAWERTPFYILGNELEVADARRHEWSLVRLFDFSLDAPAFELRRPLEPR